MENEKWSWFTGGVVLGLLIGAGVGVGFVMVQLEQAKAEAAAAHEAALLAREHAQRSEQEARAELERARQVAHPQIAKAKQDVALLKAFTLEKAILAFYIDHDSYPEDLQALTKKSANGAGPYLVADGILDPWDRIYQYDPAGPKNNGSKPDVFTTTPDGKVIGNWKTK